ncbi:MAG: hypothetical protein OXD29_06680 [Roseovarius sp.]|nr:hypothetical protein [Roseovarius sp.]
MIHMIQSLIGGTLQDTRHIRQLSTASLRRRPSPAEERLAGAYAGSSRSWTANGRLRLAGCMKALVDLERIDPDIALPPPSETAPYSLAPDGW